MKFLPIFRLRVLVKKNGHLLDQRLSPHGLNTTKTRVLGALTHHGELTPTDLLPWASVEPASMSLLLQSMEREGWIERRPHPTDKRAVLLSLTDSGRATHKVAVEVLEAANDDLFGALSERDREEFDRITGLLFDRLGELGIGCQKPKETKRDDS